MKSSLTIGVLIVCAIWANGAAARADSPSGQSPEIFRESFDTYCTPDGYPGTPPCPTGSAKDATALQRVWQTTSRSDATGLACGTQFVIDDNPVYLSSAPFGGRHPCLTNDPIGQQSVSDWHSPTPAPGIGFLIQQAHPGFDKIAATDEAPLVLEFYLSGVNKPEWPIGGGLSRSTAYIELALGEDRANTDYVWGPNCSTFCTPYINQGPFQIMCATGNPANGVPLPASCPSRATAPIHAAVAVGTMPMLDPDPCHCGPNDHGSLNEHLVIFDGQLWWNLRNNSPMSSGGTITPEDPNAPMPPPEGLNTPGNFQLMAGKPKQSGPPNQWVKLTIKTTTFDVEMTARELSLVNGYVYRVTSVMNGINRKYLGCFDQLRAGLGTGCQLATPDAWTDNCVGSGRNCIASPRNEANAVIFDDLVLRGGAGCSTKGACCHADNTCAQLEPAECAGVFKGTSTRCDQVACCPVIFGDANLDGFVDMDDFAALQRCITAGGGEIAGTCTCLNANGDGVIDGRDVQAFVHCANGPIVPGDSTAPCRGADW